jgi:hypothetical protein
MNVIFCLYICIIILVKNVLVSAVTVFRPHKDQRMILTSYHRVGYHIYCALFTRELGCNLNVMCFGSAYIWHAFNFVLTRHTDFTLSLIFTWQHSPCHMMMERMPW